MPRRIFVYLRANKPGSVRSKSLAAIRYVDELRAEPGDHVPVVKGTFEIAKGQTVRFPAQFYLKDNIHRWAWLKRVHGFDAESEVESAPEPEPEPVPEVPKKRGPGRPRKVIVDAD